MGQIADSDAPEGFGMGLNGLALGLIWIRLEMDRRKAERLKAAAFQKEVSGVWSSWLRL
jgi:hypothetical protein